VINFELFFLSDSFWFHAKNTPAIIIVGLWSSDPDLSLKNTLSMENDGNKYELFTRNIPICSLILDQFLFRIGRKAEQEEKAS
jgi:hypothetical protein